LKKKIITNVLYSFIEKLSSIISRFLISILLIRLLSREDYGIIGTVVGYFVFINFINISIESIILRDHKKISTSISKYFSNFFYFNIAKSSIILAIALFLSFYLVNHTNNMDYFYAIISYTSILITDAFTAPLIIFTTAKFDQKRVTLFTEVRLVINVFLSFGIFLFPSLMYVAFKDIVVSIVFLLIWFIYFIKLNNNERLFDIKLIDINFLKKIIMDYSLWTHLNGVVTTFIYKSDIFFLSLFFDLAVIGNYNIALTAANVANIIPMILANQNSIAISHARDNIHANKISNNFIKVSLLIGLVSILAFIFVGEFYLKIITGEPNNENIYSYMIPIVIGLVIVKTIASPLNAYVNIKGSVKGLFNKVLMPTFVFTSISYFVCAYLWGPLAVARVNILNSIFWLALMIKYASNYNYSFRSIFKIKKSK